MGIAQEGLQTIKLEKMPAIVLKIDLDKAFDNVNWSYQKLVLF